MTSRTQNYLTFRVGREWYGVSVSAVIEVLHMVALNEVPASEASGEDVLGVMTLRSQAIKVIDLRRRFGLEQPQFKLDTPIIAVRSGVAAYAGVQTGAVGIIVDEADNVTQVSEDSLTPYSGGLIESVFRLDERSVFVLNPAQIAAG